MIARLWWKETRTLWPAWPVLFGTGAALQWVLLASGSEGIRSGSLMLIALCWATIYALVVASAAFAGEREAGTLGLLDALPVDRKTLWLSKTTFALASTLGLSLIMLALGYLGSADLQDLPGTTEFIGHYGTLLFESVAWGLLWSALLRNPMIAGALALFCIGEVSYVASGGAKIEFISDSVIPTRFLMGALALAASAIAIVWRPLAGWSSSRSLNEDRADLPADSARSIRSRPASPTRVLMWKATREGFLIWLGASALCWGALAWMFQFNSASYADGMAAAFGVGAALVAGVGVFGGETAVGSQRFLLHMGVSPGPIWSRTMRAWAIGLTVTAFIILAMLSARWPGWWNQPNLVGFFTRQYDFSPLGFVAAIASVFGLAAPFANAFAVGTLAGMVFRRRITAGMIAVIVWIATAPLQFGLAIMGMMPLWALLFTPITVVGISRAWAGDWLDDRPGPARWLRLAGYLAVPSVVFPAAYIANRAWGVPDPGPVQVTAQTPAGSVPPGSDTAATYRRLAVEILPIRGTSPRGARTNEEAPFDFDRLEEDLSKRGDLLDRIHKATKLPPPQFANQPFFRVGVVPDPTSGEMSRVAWLLEQHGRGLLKRSDLAGAWEDILAQYRLARQLTGATPTSFAAHNALLVDRQATMLALDWAASDKQTSNRLRKALADLRALPPFPTLVEVLNAEAPLVERTLDLSGAELETAINGPNRRALAVRVCETMLLYSSWERERARRICRAEFKRLIVESADESNPLPDFNSYPPSQDLRRVSPLAATVMSYGWLSASLERAKAGRRGLVQVIALRAWNLDHNGTYPETLDALVPDLLDHLPLDPYSARPFGYKRSTGQEIPRLDLQSPSSNLGPLTKPGQWLLLSIGPDLHEGTAVSGRNYIDDLVFPLPSP
ncbi:hypothetical protein SAMN05444166_1948 [Singulisphaera sp. GP187]|uniref:hypothetical protein n=1 Tax=Singulisphaera sp. GP187 TaxID=1882752 RepID=UPI000929C784|nr:hypothetical protein [Singulisphaera sp. GP187]SIN99319.1 hypothetical protein SAMN05444166_1948 [Singulisphaera sp. GP187]